MTQKLIIEKIKNICKEKGVTPIFAIEGGSRLWQMESKDSDYDVRFVFKRPIKSYLRIFKEKNVINCLGKDIDIVGKDIDIVGFDIYKFAQLLVNSNPSMIEWLQSDMYYIEGEFQHKLYDIMLKQFNPKALYWHYKSMCKSNYLKYIKSGSLLSYKKYLYAMRGLVNAKYVMQTKEIPPINFNVAYKLVKIPQDIKEKLEEIIIMKRHGKEQDVKGQIIRFDEYIESFLKNEKEIQSNRTTDWQELQELMYVELEK